jgi:hypothetical protein
MLGDELDEKKLNRMKFNIIILERDNVKNREKTQEEMVESIRKIIALELKKNY